jgi:hypothetical protein
LGNCSSTLQRSEVGALASFGGGGDKARCK